MSDLPAAADPVDPGVAHQELFGSDVVRTYGDVAAEHDALARAAGIVVRTDLTQIRMWGRDPVRMLNGLITNDLGTLPADRAVYAAMLTPKGRMITDLRAFRGAAEGEILIDAPLVSSDAVREHLKKYVPPMFARSEPAGDSWSVIGVYGPASAEVVRQGLSVEQLPLSEDGAAQATFEEQPVKVVATKIAGAAGFDIFIARPAAGALRDALRAAGAEVEARPVGMEALEIARIEAGRPRFGLDINQDTLPGEAYESTGQVPRAISFTKGCYTGQEVVIRIAHRGHVNRHLRGLTLADGSSLETRANLFSAEGKEVGWTTSSARSPRFGRIALAMLRREIEVGATVRAGASDGPEAGVVELPFR